MKRTKSAFLFILPFLLFYSCNTSQLSSRKMVDIYCDIYLTDQYIENNPTYRAMADTTTVYDGIFKKHGTTSEEFISSVNYYLDDINEMKSIYKNVIKKLGDLYKEEQLIAERELEKTTREYQKTQEKLDKESNFPK